MKKLLYIIATPREEESRTMKLGEAFLEVFKEQHKDWVIDELNLAKVELPVMNIKRANGKYALLAGKDLHGEIKTSWHEVLQHIERFLTADAYFIASPMWNFNIPYMLKQYIDIIVQPKYLFQYNAEGKAEGLVKNKKMLIAGSFGGDYTTDKTKGYDFYEPYLRTIFGFVGFTDITFQIAEPMDVSKELEQQKLAEAIDAIKKLAPSWVS